MDMFETLILPSKKKEEPTPETPNVFLKNEVRCLRLSKGGEKELGGGGGVGKK